MGTKQWIEAGLWVLWLVIALVLAGCAATSVPQPVPSPAPQGASPGPMPEQSPSPPPRDVGAAPTSPVISREVREAVQQAQSDLARRLGIATAEVTFVDSEAVEWPDASLGCPEPGMMYAQVVTPGYRIILEAKGEQYEYHADRAGRIVYCPARELRLPEASVPEAARQLVDEIKAGLATELGVTQDAIGVISVEPVEWRDSSLGCPQVGEMYLQVITPGYRIVLQKGDQVFTYHSDRGRRVVRCEKPRPEPPVRLPVSLLRSDDEPAEAAQRDLAARLGAPEASVSVVSDILREISTHELEACYGTSLPSGLNRGGTGRDIILVVKDTKYRYLVVGRFLVPCFR